MSNEEALEKTMVPIEGMLDKRIFFHLVRMPANPFRWRRRTYQEHVLKLDKIFDDSDPKEFFKTIWILMRKKPQVYREAVIYIHHLVQRVDDKQVIVGDDMMPMSDAFRDIYHYKETVIRDKFMDILNQVPKDVSNPHQIPMIRIAIEILFEILTNPELIAKGLHWFVKENASDRAFPDENLTRILAYALLLDYSGLAAEREHENYRMLTVEEFEATSDAPFPKCVQIVNLLRFLEFTFYGSAYKILSVVLPDFLYMSASTKVNFPTFLGYKSLFVMIAEQFGEQIFWESAIEAWNRKGRDFGVEGTTPFYVFVNMTVMLSTILKTFCEPNLYAIRIIEIILDALNTDRGHLDTFIIARAYAQCENYLLKCNESRNQQGISGELLLDSKNAPCRQARCGQQVPLQKWGLATRKTLNCYSWACNMSPKINVEIRLEHFQGVTLLFGCVMNNSSGFLQSRLALDLANLIDPTQFKMHIDRDNTDEVKLRATALNILCAISWSSQNHLHAVDTDVLFGYRKVLGIMTRGALTELEQSGVFRKAAETIWYALENDLCPEARRVLTVELMVLHSRCDTVGSEVEYLIMEKLLENRSKTVSVMRRVNALIRERYPLKRFKKFTLIQGSIDAYL
ncbi:unnamed protein product [Caenorhabditis bovis]|uniref:Uncharacterized protein n=1 Tax=Caenorhabditis bovis TaxID=2654633 RepID=A0A8S1F6A5_9PELO|nr:unnamed protein product [Caenorhabditis bovis]